MPDFKVGDIVEFDYLAGWRTATAVVTEEISTTVGNIPFAVNVEVLSTVEASHLFNPRPRKHFIIHEDGVKNVYGEGARCTPLRKKEA